MDRSGQDERKTLYDDDFYAYPAARREAASETGLPIDIFPASCPFTIKEIEDHAFWPASGSPPA